MATWEDKRLKKEHDELISFYNRLMQSQQRLAEIHSQGRLSPMIPCMPRTAQTYAGGKAHSALPRTPPLPVVSTATGWSNIPSGGGGPAPKTLNLAEYNLRTVGPTASQADLNNFSVDPSGDVVIGLNVVYSYKGSYWYSGAPATLCEHYNSDYSKSSSAHIMVYDSLYWDGADRLYMRSPAYFFIHAMTGGIEAGYTLTLPEGESILTNQTNGIELIARFYKAGMELRCDVYCERVLLIDGDLPTPKTVTIGGTQLTVASLAYGTPTKELFFPAPMGINLLSSVTSKKYDMTTNSFVGTKI